MAKQKGADSDTDMVAMARGLAEVVAEHGLSELILDTENVKLTVRRGVTASNPTGASSPMPVYAPPPMHAAPTAMAVAVAAEPVKETGHLVTSPFVGTFYRKPNPDSPSYVSLNDKVDKGAVLCIVEAMKLMNEIEADVGGTIVGILVEDGAPVEYGQPLFRIA
jgi:acetyl-CoA carboxylase biotin carboxyl carrier protein